MNRTVSRRALLGTLGAASATLATPRILLGAPAILKGELGYPLPSGLFALGVGSGDPDDSSVMLWTRLAADPLGGGGVPSQPVPVRFRVATDAGMGRIVESGTVLALAETGHAVHVLVTGLRPDTWYWYDFQVRGARSRVGRTRTFPASHQATSRMRFALVSCQDYAAGYYAAYRDMLTQNLDFVVHVGDYIYESGASATPLLPGRDHLGSEIFSVADYRNRYAQYRLDADLQNLHASVPFLCTWDDHEVDNNYAGLDAEESAPYTGDEFARRRRNGYQAYRESMALRPLNRLITPAGNLRLYRDIEFGSLATFHLLDTRQYRSDQPAGDNFGSTDPDAVAIEPVFGETLFDAQGIEDPGATLLGRTQEYWLADRLRRSRAQWNVLAQQIMVMPWNLRATGRKQVELNPSLPAPQKAAILGLIDQVANLYNVDAWDGYPAARRRLLELVARSGARNPVVLSGDIHSAWAANLLSDFSDPANADLVAAEFVCTSITSTFLTSDPRPTDFIVRASLPDNPHIGYFNGLFRGYCLCDVDRRAWQTTYRAVQGNPLDPSPLALVPQAGSPVGTDKVLRIEAGFNRPGSGARLLPG
jgi:alkaline phosphatase D